MDIHTFKCILSRWGNHNLVLIFNKKLNKFNNTRVWMLDSVYHMALRLLLNLISGVKSSDFCHYVRNIVKDIIS